MAATEVIRISATRQYDWRREAHVVCFHTRCDSPGGARVLSTAAIQPLEEGSAPQRAIETLARNVAQLRGGAE